MSSREDQARYRAKLKRDGARALILWGDDLEHPPGPIRTIELRTFPRLDDQEMAALFGLAYLGEVT